MVDIELKTTETTTKTTITTLHLAEQRFKTQELLQHELVRCYVHTFCYLQALN